MPDSVTRISAGMFYGCSSLTSIEIPDSVTHIGNYAFQFCSSLTSIVIPNSVISIGESTFADCVQLKTVSLLPQKAPTMGNNAFSGTHNDITFYCYFSALNSYITSNNIINYNAEDRRRLDLVFSVSYDADIAKAKQVILAVIKKNNLIFTDPEPVIAVKEHAASSVNIACLIWCTADEYWNVFYYMQEAVKLSFDENNISIPYGQLDVHITKE
jgi:hypothetical protein